MLPRSAGPGWAECQIHVSSGCISDSFQMLLNLKFPFTPSFLRYLTSTGRAGEAESIDRWHQPMGDRAGGRPLQHASLLPESFCLFSQKVAARPTERKRSLSNWPRFLTHAWRSLGLSGSGRGNHLSLYFGSPVSCAVRSGSSEFRGKAVD